MFFTVGVVVVVVVVVEVVAVVEVSLIVDVSSDGISTKVVPGKL
jgi:hypothetical protein